MKARLNNPAARCSAVACVLTIIALAAFTVYGLSYPRYADYAVTLFFLGGAACFAGYIFWNHIVAELLPLAGVVLVSLAMNILFLNSFTVWADWYGNFHMYGSQGGVTPVIIQMVICFAAAIAGIVSCFNRKNKEA